MSVGLPPTIIFDIEASGLFSSYPTEIAWCDPATDAPPVSRLIRPPEMWVTDLRWDPTAESMTGISMDMVQREGVPAEDVAAEIVESWGDRRALADGLPHDLTWLRLLLEWTPPGAVARFGVSDVKSACLELDGPVTWRLAVEEAERFHPRRHRAALDVARLRAIWRYCAGLE